MQGIPNALQAAERAVHAQAAGQTALFGGDERGDTLDHVLTPVREWSKRERLDGERESLGLYLTGHPFDDFAEHCKHFTNGAIAKVLGSLPSSALPYHVRKEAILAGVVVDVRRRGNRVSIVLDDDTERVEVTMFEEVFAQAKHVIAKHAVLIAEGQLRYDDFINGWRAHGKTSTVGRRSDRRVRTPAHDPLAERGRGTGARARAAARLEAVHARPLRGLDRVSAERRRGVADARRGMVRAAQARAARSADAAARRRLLSHPLPEALRLKA